MVYCFPMTFEQKNLRTLNRKKTNRFEGGGFTIVNNLTDEPDTILIATGAEIGADLGIDPLKVFRPRSYFRYNLKTGGQKIST